MVILGSYLNFLCELLKNSVVTFSNWYDASNFGYLLDDGKLSVEYGEFADVQMRKQA
ncbi:MAG: hypothetical protein R3E08_12980 [Thiotrichaceae bacterium]